MCDQTEISYLDGDVVWVKLGSCWWPGEVVAPDKLAPEVLQSFRKPPIATVKFFQEDAYEYVKNINSIYKYQCSRKNEFINKGLALYRNKHGLMEKFPEDVIRAETKVGGDIEILTRDEFQQTKKESYAGIFGTPAKRAPSSAKKGKGRLPSESPKVFTPIRRMKEKADYKVHILVQGSSKPKTPTTPESPTVPAFPSTPSTSAVTASDEGVIIEESESTDQQPDDNIPENVEKTPAEIPPPITPTTPTTPTTPATPTTPSSSAGTYACHACQFTTTRLNVLIMHNKTHSVSFMSYTPSPIRIPLIKTPAKSTPAKTPKQRKPRKEKTEKTVTKKVNTKKRSTDDKINAVETKKIKTDEEIKSSLLADWDDGEEDSNDESATTAVRSPEVPLGAESPAVPTSAELTLVPAPRAELPDVPLPAELPYVPASGDSPLAQIPAELLPSRLDSVADKITKNNSSTEKPETSSDSNKYEFCEDEDWPVEADGGRKIPRVKNPVRSDENKRISIDEDDMAREVAELLNKTAVPELPSVPEPLIVEENFPEPSVAKSPDKSVAISPSKPTNSGVSETPPTKAIFKTKTFFRSRHSRSQDAIGKYVAEQLNNVEKMDIADSDINGSDNVSSPEARDSSPIEHVKVARLAPKIQLKRLKAEAQLREKSNNRFEPSTDPYSLLADIMMPDEKVDSPLTVEMKEKDLDTSCPSTQSQDVLYPTQEIKLVKETLSNENSTEKSSLNYDASTEGEDTSETLFDEPQQESLTELDRGSGEVLMLHPRNKENEETQDLEIEEESTQDSEIVNNESKENSDESEIEVPQPLILRRLGMHNNTEERVANQRSEPFINDSTSAVDALLSVSREADRVTRNISDDPPEDLFEDDRDGSNSNINGETVDDVEYSKVSENTKERKTKETEQTIHQFVQEDEDNDNVQKESAFLSCNEQEMADNSKTTDQSPFAKDEESISINENKESIGHDKMDKLWFPETDEEVSQNDDQEEIFQNRDEMMSQSNDQTINEDSEKELPLSDTKEVPEETENNMYRDNNLEIPPLNEGAEKKYFLNSFSENEQEITTTQKEPENVSEENMFLQNEEFQEETEIPIENTDEYIAGTEILENEEVVTTPFCDDSQKIETKNIECVVENVPSESDLQVAEALINLPATALHNNTEHIENQELTSSFDIDNIQEEIIPASENIAVEETVVSENAPESTSKHEDKLFNSNDESANVRFETEQEMSENLNAAQSLLNMSKSIEHKIGLTIPDLMESSDGTDIISPNMKQNNGVDKSIEQNVIKLPKEITEKGKSKLSHASSSKLLQILEEPTKLTFNASKITPTKQILMRGKEKILNFDVAKSTFNSKPISQKQKIIIRRTAPGKSIISNERTGQDKIILSKSGNTAHSDSVKTFTIQTKPDAPSDANTIIIQQKIRKLAKPAAKLQKLKPHPSIVASVNEPKSVANTSIDNVMFDINSMPIVLSEDLLTAESIEKMPVVMSDSKIISQPPIQTKIIKPKHTIETEKVTVTSMPKKQEMKTLLINPVTEVSKTPNILSKSAKLRASKPMLVIDKTTGKQKIIMTKAESTIKEIKQIQPPQTILQTPTFIQAAPTLIQAAPKLVQATPTLVQGAPTIVQSAPKKNQQEKFIILPTQNAQRTGRTQKIVIDPQTGKAHVIVSKPISEPVTTVPENKPVSAKLVPSKSDTNAPGNTVMIITNAQGAQSRIVLTPEHEKILFPNKQQQKASQLKTIAHRITTASASPQVKTVLNPPALKQVITATKQPTRIVPKQKNAIITSKGQLIVGGRIATTSQNIAPMPEIRPVVPKRLAQTEPRKLVQAIQKTNSEPIIFLQQKNGTVVQLTASQFEQLQRSGQIVQKTTTQHTQQHVSQPVSENKRVIIQKSRTIVEAGASQQKARVRKTAAHAQHMPTPPKKVKHEVAIAPAPARTSTHLPSLTPIQSALPTPALAPVVTIAPVATFAPVHTFTPAGNTSQIASASNSFTEFENFEEMLPASAIARQLEPAPPVPVPELVSAEPALTPAPDPPPSADTNATALADGQQLLAVPGEHFGGPVGSFYLCIEENGTYTPIDNRPLVLENNQLVPMAEVAPPVPERRDILEAALANSDVFRAADAPPDFRELNANVSVHCRVSETSTTLHQPIMTPLEMPSKGEPEPALPTSLEDGLAVIGVTPHSVPTSLDLPITVTDPRIAPRTSDPLSGSYTTTLMASPGAELCHVSAEECVGVGSGPISMPLLTEEEETCGIDMGGKSMPILTDELGERAVSSVSSLGSPGSPGEAGAWGRRLLTPGSDSDHSVEIPLQPSIQLTVGDLSDHT